MQKLIYILSLLLLFTSFSACDPCRKTDCGNGVCDGGDCTCNDGYEKDASGKCSVEERTKFLGNWTGMVTITGPISGSGTATIPVVVAGDVKQVVIGSLFTCSGGSLPITATVDGNKLSSMNSVICAPTTITFSNVNWVVSGNTTNFSFTYNVEGAGAGTYSGTLTK